MIEQSDQAVQKQNLQQNFDSMSLEETAPKDLSVTNTNNPPQLNQTITMLLGAQYVLNLETICFLMNCLRSSDIIQNHRGVIGVRKLLSVQYQPPIQQFLDQNVIPELTKFLSHHDYPQLQVQAAWALTNIVSGTSQQCATLVNQGGIQMFLSLLECNNLSMVQQVIWGLGNIAGDCYKFRDKIIYQGGIDLIINAIKQNMNNQSLINQGVWLISNLLRGSPLPKFKLIQKGFIFLCQALLLDHIVKKQNIIDNVWALAHHSENPTGMKIIIDYNLVPRLLCLLNFPEATIKIPALRCIGNICTGSSIQLDHVVQCAGSINQFYELLFHPKKSVRKQICWIFSNITADTTQKINMIIDNTPLIQQFIAIFQNDQVSIKDQITYVFANMCISTQPQKVLALFHNYKILYYVIPLLSNGNPQTVIKALLLITEALKLGQKLAGSGQNIMAKHLQQFNGIQVIQNLQVHQNQQIYQKALQILSNFFSAQMSQQIEPLA